MNPESLGGGIAGAVILALAGWLGKALVTYTRGRTERRKLTTEQELTREKQTFAAAERRITDLREALRDVAGERDQLQAICDRLRAERDTAKESAFDERMRAKELDQRLRATRAEHQRELDDCTEDLDDARDTLARLNRRDPETPG